MPTMGEALVAEREDPSGPGTAGPAVPLEVDAQGYLRVTLAGSPGSTLLDGHVAVYIEDVVGRRLREETLLTLRAILNHLRALTTGSVVDETAPIQGGS